MSKTRKTTELVVYTFSAEYAIIPQFLKVQFFLLNSSLTLQQHLFLFPVLPIVSYSVIFNTFMLFVEERMQQK